jgi:hypothetical protein
VLKTTVDDSMDSPGTNTTDTCSSGSDFSSATTPVDPTYKVMESEAAWELLVDRFHFAKDQEFYCLPGEKNMPGNNQFAQEGISYFSSIEALRKNLCAYRLPESIKALSDEEKVDISRWVRYVHISDLGDGAHINEDLIDPTIQKQAWTWLQQLGFKYASGYVIPKSATHPFKKFERAEDFYTYLARSSFLATPETSPLWRPNKNNQLC